MDPEAPAPDAVPARRGGGPSGAVIVVASLAILILTSWLAVKFYIPTIRVDPRRGAVGGTLKQLGVTFGLYESKYNGGTTDPSLLGAFARETLVSGGDAALTCPGCGRGFVYLPAEGSCVTPGGTAWSWKDGLIRDGAPPDLPIVWHRCPNFAGDNFVLFYSGRVEKFRSGSAEDEYLLKLENPGPVWK
ncbi:MAG: hypothetical protein IT452_09470 [Planctomycetia bacterium]|nr:hypothetical protein [Planctomycetia bacterium]